MYAVYDCRLVLTIMMFVSPAGTIFVEGFLEGIGKEGIVGAKRYIITN